MLRNRKQPTKVVKSSQKKNLLTLNKYDVLFDLNHLKQLLNSDNFLNDVPNYLNKFFFKYGNDIFFDNDNKLGIASIPSLKISHMCDELIQTEPVKFHCTYCNKFKKWIPIKIV